MVSRCVIHFFQKNDTKYFCSLLAIGKAELDLEADAPLIKKITTSFIKDLMTLEDVSEAYVHETQERYCAFLFLFGRRVVSQNLYKERRDCSHERFEKVYTMQDEALAIVILKNNLLKWQEEAKLRKLKCEDFKNTDLMNVKITSKEMADCPKPLYTMNLEYDESNLRSGWGDAGFKEFMKILKKVNAFRDKDEFMEIKNFTMDTLSTKKKKSRKRMRYDVDVSLESNVSVGDSADDLIKQYMELTKFEV